MLSSLYSYEMIMKMYLNIFHKLATSSRKRKKRKELELNKVSSSKSNVHTYMHMHKNTEVKHLTSKWGAKYQTRISWRGTHRLSNTMVTALPQYWSRHGYKQTKHLYNIKNIPVPTLDMIWLGTFYLTHYFRAARLTVWLVQRLKLCQLNK